MNRPSNRIERVAARIIEEVMVDERVWATEVVVRKVRPPVPVDVATTAVRCVALETMWN